MTGPEGMVDISALGTRVAFGDHLVQAPGEAYALQASHIFNAVQSSAAIARMVSRAAEISHAYTLQSLACLNFHQIEARFCRWMLMSRYHLQTDTFSLTHEFLAAMLGVQRSSITVIANKLQVEGLISYHRGEVSIINPEGLEKRTCECYARVLQRIELAFEPPQ